jgi:predicted TIM-barrel fold metal-dependent hydrolase
MHQDPPRGRLLQIADAQDRQRVLDEEGVICSVLFPSRAMDVNTMRDKAFVAAYCQAYNSFIADVCRKAPALKAMAVLSFDNVSAAVEELTRSVTKLGLVGVVMSSYGLQEHIGTVKYWPIYEEMQRLNVHLGIHNSSVSETTWSYSAPAIRMRTAHFRWPLQI